MQYTRQLYCYNTAVCVIIQEEKVQSGYLESSILDGDAAWNEAFTNRIKCLKHNARAAVVLQHQQQQQSFLLADLVGATVAGLAMSLAIGGIYICYRFSQYAPSLQLNHSWQMLLVPDSILWPCDVPVGHVCMCDCFLGCVTPLYSRHCWQACWAKQSSE